MEVLISEITVGKRHRKAPRLVPCEVCGYPLSQLHHMMQQQHFGKANDIWNVQLCACCHELYHLIYNKQREKIPDRLVALFYDNYHGIDKIQERYWKLSEMCEEAIRIEVEEIRKKINEAFPGEYQ